MRASSETTASYEEYRRTQHGNGDGLGDLIGVLDRLDYLAWLGIDGVSLTPFYVSPLADWGYDVADHRRIDPRFGDLEVFDAVVAKPTGSGCASCSISSRTTPPINTLVR
jgi:alpha-glucosidase